MSYRMNVLGFPLHPVLFALFPLLSLYAQNDGILQPRSLVMPSACMILLAALLLAAFTLMLRDRRRAALVTSTIVLSLFFYPTLVGALAIVALPPSSVSLAVWALCLTGGLVLIGRTHRDLRPITTALDAVAAAALALPLIGVAPKLWAPAVPPRTVASSPSAAGHTEMPDIYYIILDGYARHDVLAEYYGFDNREFVDFLRARGFYFAAESRSNYAQTYLSLASSLNQTYLDDVARRMGKESNNRQPLREMIATNRAAEVLHRHGYTFVVFSSGYTGTEIPGADVYIEAPTSLSEFQHLLLESTPLAALSRLLVGSDVRYVAHRHRVLHTLDTLGPLAAGQRPAFVFAHVYAPHPPFVFATDGELIERNERFSMQDGKDSVPGGLDQYVARYRAQLAFVNRKVMQALDRILASSPAPIVILQSDHGPGSRRDQRDVSRTDHWERMSILNAYHFPDRNYRRLYPSISPVNSFRLVFAQYLNEDIPLLEDRSYSSTWQSPYDFVDVTDVQRGPHLPFPGGQLGEVAAAQRGS